MNREINIAGKKIFYRVIGNGKPVMLVHGFGETGEVWKEQARYLNEKFQLIIPDLPGSGNSETIGDMSVEGMAEVIMDIWEMESGSRSDARRIIIGHSMGGYITLAFAEKYQHSLSAFGLFHSTAFPDTEEKKAARRKGIDFIKQHGGFEFLKTSTPNLFSESSKEKFPGLIDEFIQSLKDFSAASLIAYYEAMIRRPDRTHVLRDTSLPVLFVAGQYDTAIPLQDVLKQCHLPLRSHFHILHQSAHMGMMEETAEANQILEQFLNEVSSR